MNSALVLLYWRVGKRIRQDILKEKRAEYGEQILYAVSAQLVKEFGTGFSEKNLRRMVQFAEAFPEEQIVVTLSRQLGWSHFVAIIHSDDNLPVRQSPGVGGPPSKNCYKIGFFV